MSGNMDASPDLPSAKHTNYILLDLYKNVYDLCLMTKMGHSLLEGAETAAQ